MEEKIKAEIYGIFRQYGADKTSDYPLKEARILTRCMNEIASHPWLEKELLKNEAEAKVAIHHFVMQMILEDLPIQKVDSL